MQVPESFWGAVRAICKVLSTNYGQSRIDFGAPFSLQEFVQLSRGAQTPALADTQLSKGHHRWEEHRWCYKNKISLRARVNLPNPLNSVNYFIFCRVLMDVVCTVQPRALRKKALTVEIIVTISIFSGIGNRPLFSQS